MRIAFVAAECSPLVKVGGLADVVGALPKALVARGHDVRIFMPSYEAIDRQRFPSRPTNWRATVVFDGQPTIVTVYETVLPNSTIPIYQVVWPDEFRGEVYPLGQDFETLQSVIRRFMRFSVAVDGLLGTSSWKPDRVHCHDWHTGILPALLRARNLPAPTTFTIHNIDIQGKWNPTEALSWLPVDTTTPPWSLRDTKGDFNMLQIGIHTATQVSTVSPTYASEVVTHEYGAGLAEDLRATGVVGIVNGIDTDSYNPSTDQALYETYDVGSAVAGKASNKASLQLELGLPVDPSAPLFVNVGRLVGQKGIDLIVPLMERIVAAGGQVAFLGSGFPDIQGAIKAAANRPGVAARFEFNAGLGRRLYAGGDFFLMPSRFEPCGLGQLIAMRYGTIPIVRDTGGLHDTVQDLDADSDRGVGLRFSEPTVEALWTTIERAFALYRDRQRMALTIQRSMSTDSSWYTSADAYIRLYERQATARR